MYACVVTNLEALKIAHRVQSRLLAIQQALDIAELKEPDMPVSPAVATFAQQVDDATNQIAARIQKLIDNSGTLSAEDTAALQAEVTKLQALGKDPTVAPAA